jgi:hypothetical protein
LKANNERGKIPAVFQATQIFTRSGFYALCLTRKKAKRVMEKGRFTNVEKQQIKIHDIRLNRARLALLKIHQNFIVCVNQIKKSPLVHDAEHCR